jgi:hypothetical protein
MSAEGIHYSFVKFIEKNNRKKARIISMFYYATNKILTTNLGKIVFMQSVHFFMKNKINIL